MRENGVHTSARSKKPGIINKELKRDPKYNEAIIKCYRVLISANRAHPFTKGGP